MSTPVNAIPVSTIPAVKAFFVAGLTALLTPDVGKTIGVFYDVPNTNAPDDMVVIGRVSNRVAKPRNMVGSGARLWIYEEYSIDVAVDSFRGGDQPQQVFERAWAVASLVESFVRSDPSLGGKVVQCSPATSSDDSQWDQKHNGRIVHISLTFTIGAQI